MAILIGDGGRKLEYIEPIPGMYLPPGSDVRAGLRGLFPRSHFPGLWAKHPDAFGDPGEAGRPAPHVFLWCPTCRAGFLSPEPAPAHCSECGAALKRDGEA